MNYILTLASRVGYNQKPAIQCGKYYKIGDQITQRDADIMISAGQAILVPVAGEPWKVSARTMHKLLEAYGVDLWEAGHAA